MSGLRSWCWGAPKRRTATGSSPGPVLHLDGRFQQTPLQQTYKVWGPPGSVPQSVLMRLLLHALP